MGPDDTLAKDTIIFGEDFSICPCNQGREGHCPLYKAVAITRCKKPSGRAELAMILKSEENSARGEMSYARSAPYHDPRLSPKSALKFLPKQLGNVDGQ